MLCQTWDGWHSGLDKYKKEFLMKKSSWKGSWRQVYLGCQHGETGYGILCHQTQEEQVSVSRDVFATMNNVTFKSYKNILPVPLLKITNYLLKTFESTQENQDVTIYVIEVKKAEKEKFLWKKHVLCKCWFCLDWGNYNVLGYTDCLVRFVLVRCLYI